MQTNEHSDSPAAGDSSNFLWNVQHSEQVDRRGLPSEPSPANEARESDPRSFLQRDSDEHFQSWDDICYWHDLLTRLNSPFFQAGPANLRQPGPANHGGRPAGTSYRRDRECAQCSTKYLPRQCRCSLVQWVRWQFLLQYQQSLRKDHRHCRRRYLVEHWAHSRWRR